MTLQRWKRSGLGCIAAALIGGLSLTGCGSDPDKAAEFTKAFETALQNDNDTEYSAAEARCIAQPLVVALTVKQLETNKVTAKQVAAAKDLDDLNLKPSAAQSTAIADEIVRCVDASKKLLSAAKETNPELKPDAAAAKCVKDALKKSSVYRDNLRDSIQQGKDYKPDAEAAEEFVMKTLGACELALYSKAAYVEAGLKSFDAASDDNPFTEDDAECIIEGIVDVITPVKLSSEAVRPPDFEEDSELILSDIVSRDEADKIAEKLESCIDLIDFIRQVFEQVGLFDELSPEFSDCFFKALGEDPKVASAFRDAFVAGFLGDEEAASDIDFMAIGEELGAKCAESLL